MMELKKQSLVSLDIVDVAYGGYGVAKPDGFVVFVEGAAPGDRVLARIIKKTKNHANAIVEEIETPSDRRIEAPCPIFDHCGGCTWQELPYEDQLHWKHKQVVDTLEHLAKLELPEVAPMIASPGIWNYRNKMEFTFGTDGQGRPILGFHVPRRYDRIFEVQRCLIHPEPFDTLLSELTLYAREQGLTSYDPKTHRGFARHAVMRSSDTTGEIMLILITSTGSLPEPERLALRLKDRCPALKGFIWGVNDRVADVAVIEDEKYRWGDPTLTETINGLSFSISPMSFFQTNTAAAELLYQVVIEMAESARIDCVLDAYCGAGAIALHLASRARRVVGIDISRDSIWDARLNARNNSIENSTFLAGSIDDGLRLVRGAMNDHFSTVVIDPPRGGMDKRSLSRLIGLQAPSFIYVSCNPATLARDLQTICDGGYRITAIQPVDMFPHTFHIEVVVRLEQVDRG